MAAAKKTGIVAKVKKAIVGMFSDGGKRKTAAPTTTLKRAGKKAAKKATKVVRRAVEKVTASTKKSAKATKQATGKKSLSKTPAADKRSASGTRMDRKLVALSEPYEVRDWCKSLGCTEDELKAAVAAVGHSAAKVRAHLAKQKA